MCRCKLYGCDLSTCPCSCHGLSFAVAEADEKVKRFEARVKARAEAREPATLYIAGMFVMSRSSDGNPEVVHHMTHREFYCVSKGMDII